MSTTEPVDAAPPPNPFEDGIPFGTKLQELAEQRRDDPAVSVIAPDGNAQTLTFGELDARANQWGRALAAIGAETGSNVALAIPNSQHLVLATLGCWKIGAVPIPMHWDLPDWERDRVRAVIDPAVVVDEKSRWELDARAVGESENPLSTAISPTANGICSSGSTGVPKVILNLAPSLWIPQQGEPFMSNWTPVEQPQTIMVPAPMYHTNGFATLPHAAGRRPFGDTGKVQRGTGSGRDRATPDHQLHRDADDAGTHRRACPMSGAATCPASSGSCRARR